MRSMAKSRADKSRVTRGVVGLALSLLLVAACGGNSDSAASPASASPQNASENKPAQTASAGSSTTDLASASKATPPPTAAGASAAVSSKPGSSTAMSAMTSASAAGAVAAATAASASGTSAAGAAASAAGAAGAGAQPAAGSGAAGAGSAAAGGGAVQKPCPATLALKAGDNRKQLKHGGRDRQFTVYVPTSITAMTPAPLVLDFHGNGSSGMQEESGSGWRQKADAEHFIVAYPDGVGNGWNVGNCCGEALNSMVDDVGFARAMVENISSEACVDVHRTYATGISNGAGLAHRLACEAADVFAAIAAASADLVTEPCKPARPISEISVRGLSDTLVAYEGGNTGSTGWYSPGAKGTLELWKKIDGCSGTASMSMEYCETYNQCMAGVEVTLCSLPGTGHILYTNSLGFSVPDTAWEMFKRQTLP